MAMVGAKTTMARTQTQVNNALYVSGLLLKL